MKIFHIADLHLGKRVNEYNMIEEQRYILNQILDRVAEEKPDALILAGDIYDRTIPATDAVELLNYFLKELNKHDMFIYIISGNHDSKERLSFASDILRSSNIFIEGNFKTELFKHSLSDEIDVYLLPFTKPLDTRSYYEEHADSYQKAFELILGNTNVDKSKFNIILSHQFITHNNTEPELSESEVVSVGGLDNIDTSVFKDFDYVALGHIHKPQSIGHDHIRYSGSILKYSLSEVNGNKSITVLDIDNKDLTISKIVLKPQKEMRHIEGYLDDILKDNTETTEDFIYVTLKDEDEIYDAIGKLRSKFPNLLNIQFENQRLEHHNTEILSYEKLNESSPLDLFKEFFFRQNNTELSESQIDFVSKIMEDLDETN
ncbi:MAG: exonuclease SbcCD subunit D [Erysipelothrix sp.]|nr:exonuclease SbcCD subunit D [Erysipelothrix sp.]